MQGTYNKHAKRTLQRATSATQRSMEQNILHLMLSERVLGFLQLIRIWSRGQTPAPHWKDMKREGSANHRPADSEKSHFILQAFALQAWHRLHESLPLSVAQCVHTCTFLFHSLIFVFLLLTNFLANASGLPLQLTPPSEPESCRQDNGCRQRGAELKVVPVHTNSPHGWRDKESFPARA